MNELQKEMDIIDSIVVNVEKAVIGKRYELMNVIKGIIAAGHILIEDVPGVGKTTMVKALSKSMDLKYSRIQFTPDLLPSDITGVSIYNQKTNEFEFIKGPIFCNMLLADEINRTSPKTQSALLQVMEERQVTEGEETYDLREPFIVMATQNPIEYEGTFRLPEAQLDRFMMRVTFGYPSEINEVAILKTYKETQPLDDLQPVVGAEEILWLQKRVREIHVAEEIYDYIVKVVSATRNNKLVTLGASPRASLALLRISQANALINNRSYVIPEDVRLNAISVLAHRIRPSSLAKTSNYNAERILEDIIKTLPIPKLEKRKPLI